MTLPLTGVGSPPQQSSGPPNPTSLTGTGATVTLPANVNGVGMLIVVAYYPGGATPVGWTPVVVQLDLAGDNIIVMWEKGADGSSNVTIPSGLTAVWASFYDPAFTTVDKTAHLAGAASPATAPTVTPTASGRLWCAAGVDGNSTITGPGDLTNTASLTNPAGVPSQTTMMVGYKSAVNGVATGAHSFSYTGPPSNAGITANFK